MADVMYALVQCNHLRKRIGWFPRGETSSVGVWTNSSDLPWTSSNIGSTFSGSLYCCCLNIYLFYNLHAVSAKTMSKNIFLILTVLLTTKPSWVGGLKALVYCPLKKLFFFAATQSISVKWYQIWNEMFSIKRLQDLQTDT